MTLIIVAFPFLRSSLLRFQYGACHFFDLLNPFFAAQWPPRFFRLSQALDFRFVFGTLTKEGGKVPIPFKNGCNLCQFIVLARKMGGDTRPPPVLCLLHKLGSHGIERNVTYRIEQMYFVHHHRSKALPQMTSRSQASIDLAGIAPMRIGKSLAQAVFMRVVTLSAEHDRSTFASGSEPSTTTSDSGSPRTFAAASRHAW